MAGPTVGIRFQGDDYVSPTVKTIKGSVDGLGASAKSSILTGFGLGVGVAAFGLVKQAVGAVIGPLGDAWQLSKDTQVAQVLLAQALKNNIPNWNGNVKGADDFALAQGRLGFHSNDVRNALGILVGITHDLGKAQADVALAQDLARSKGIDLATATEIVTKAELGNGRALKGLGIDIGGATTAAQLMVAVQKNVTKTAEEWAKTSEGRAAVAQVKLAEVMTKVGKVIDNVAQTVIPIAATAVSFLMDNFSKLLPGIIAVAGAITVALIPSLVAMGVAAWAAMAPMLPVIAVLAALGIGATLVASAFDASTQKVREAETHFRGMGKSTAAALNVIPKAAMTAMTDTAAAIREGGGQVTDAASTAWHGISAEMDLAHDKAVAAAQALPGDVAKALRAESSAVDDAMKQLSTDMTSEIDNAVRVTYLKALLIGPAIRDGLASGKPVAIAEAHAAQLAIITELNDINSGAQLVAAQTGVTLQFAFEQVAIGAAASGRLIGTSWISALIAGIQAGRLDMITTVTGIRNIIGHSLPTEGPLKGDAAEKGGLSIGKAWTSGIGKGIGPLNLPSLPGMTGGGSGLAAAGVGGGGGPPEVHIHIDQGAYIDGPSVDYLARTIAQRLNLVGVT